MTREVRIRPEAEQDLADAAEWYEKQRAGLGQAFLDEALLALSVIADTPTLHPVVHRPRLVR